MSTRQLQNKIKRILQLQEQIKTADEAICGLLDQVARNMQPGEQVTVNGQHYTVRDIFVDGNATWRPARVHRYSIKEVKEPRQ